MYQTTIFIFLVTLLISDWNGKPGTDLNFPVDSLHSDEFVEKDFPYITVPLVATNLGEDFPIKNLVARGLAIQLGNSAYACFDMDLLRWSVAWEGEFLPMILPAQGSFKNYFEYNKGQLPKISGSARIATGMYPGWSVGEPQFQEVRDKNQETEGLFWGPIPVKSGRWKGVYPFGNSAVLSYTIGEQDILELPGSRKENGITVFTRTFKMSPSTEKMFLNVAEVLNGKGGETESDMGSIYTAEGDTVTMVSLIGTSGEVRVIEDQYISVSLPPSKKSREFSILVWKGPSTEIAAFKNLNSKFTFQLPDITNGIPARWKNAIVTKGVLSPDTAAFVTDILTLPVPNPRNRPVRVADIAFFSNGNAAISTYEGDVWTVEGINDLLEGLTWRRFATGFYEPFSIEIHNDQIYVYGKEGIVRLHDLNGDGEADFYENYCNLMQQSVGTREWAADMVFDKNGDIYIAKGGHLSGTSGVLPYLSGITPPNVYAATTQHSGSVLKITKNGTEIELIASGLRMPYIGLNRQTGLLSASDQQGNFVQATPIYLVNKGNYFGVPISKHTTGDPQIENPLTWIPHRVDRSGASQAWIESDKMGPLSQRMVHFSFGRPGIFRVFQDISEKGIQGGVSSINANYPAPIIKGETNPADGQLYVTGFNNYASNSFGISALIRLRYTGMPSYMLSGFQAGKQGVLLSFDSALNDESVQNVKNFVVKRWNYKRTENYGSGHFKLDGSPGEEVLPVLESYLSMDKKNVLLLIPDMKESDQMEISYKLVADDGKQFEDILWISVFQLKEIDFMRKGFKNVNVAILELSKDQITGLVKSDQPVTVDRGKELFEKTGCKGCHSTGRKTEGMYGPPFQGIYGTKRELADGNFVLVDDAYLRESIIAPTLKVSKGYDPNMPSFEGVLSDSDIESIIFYIKTLYQ